MGIDIYNIQDRTSYIKLIIANNDCHRVTKVSTAKKINAQVTESI